MLQSVLFASFAFFAANFHFLFLEALFLFDAPVSRGGSPVCWVSIFLPLRRFESVVEEFFLRGERYSSVFGWFFGNQLFITITNQIGPPHAD